MADFQTSILVAQHPTIQDPNKEIWVIDSDRSVGISSSPTFFPLSNTHNATWLPVASPPQAANILSFQAIVAVISAGVSGLVRKTKLRPFARSYVCRHLPTEVVTWNVVLPSGREVNGTEVEETKPIV